MGLIGKILSVFGGGSSADSPTPSSEAKEPAEPEAEPELDTEAEEEEVEEAEKEKEKEEAEPEPDAEAEKEKEEAEEDDGGMSTKAVAEMADPRRREGEDNTVHNRAENPTDHAEAEETEAEAGEAEEAEEDDGGMSTKAVAEMADPRRREGEDNTVHNRAENPDDQRAT